MRWWAAMGLLLALLAPAASAAQGEPRFGIRVGTPAEGWRPVLEVEHMLADPALEDALESGLPLRFRLRVELWEKRFFDRLADEQEVFVALVQDPLDGRLRLDAGGGERSFATLAQAEAALRQALRPALRPSGRGRFYYLASLDVETLSLSDLEELRRWLRGEVRPAVEGRAPPERALATGLQRLLVRVIGLPTRRYEARSGTFTLGG